MSKTIILSDLHIGDMLDADDFYTSGNFEKFISFLEFIEKDDDIEKIIRAGDFFELWQCKVEKVLQMYVELWKILLKLKETGKKIIYIPRNHDSLPFAKLVYKVVHFPFGPIQLTDKSDVDEEKKLIFPYYTEHNLWIEHGHRFDSYNKKLNFCGCRRYYFWIIYNTITSILIKLITIRNGFGIVNFFEKMIAMIDYTIRMKILKLLNLRRG